MAEGFEQTIDVATQMSEIFAGVAFKSRANL